MGPMGQRAVPTIDESLRCLAHAKTRSRRLFLRETLQITGGNDSRVFCPPAPGQSNRSQSDQKCHRFDCTWGAPPGGLWCRSEQLAGWGWIKRTACWRVGTSTDGFAVILHAWCQSSTVRLPGVACHGYAQIVTDRRSAFHPC